MSSSDEEDYDIQPLVKDLDSEDQCRENYRKHRQLFVHPKLAMVNKPIPKSHEGLKKNDKLVKVVLKHQAKRKLKKSFRIGTCHKIHEELQGMYFVKDETAEDTIRRMWDIKNLTTFARSLWVRRRKKRISAAG